MFGEQIGIFAKENIAENVLIGEFAADLPNSAMMSMCRKADSIISYSEGYSPEDVFIGPKDYCGYIPLVNTGTPFTSN
jgi:hypothetical protein